MKALHRLNPLRIAYLRDHLCRHFPRPDGSHRDPAQAKPLAGLSVLDIGCGGGLLCEPLARLGAEVTGIDPAPGSIEVARRHAEASGLVIRYEAASVESLAAKPGRFDAVLAMEVVEHVTDVEAFVGTACGLVASAVGSRPSGLFFGSTLNRTMKSFALAIVGAEYVLRWLPRGTHNWEKFVTPEELAAAMRAGGVTPVETSGVIFNPLADRWQLGRDTSVNYMMVGKRA